jgi:site-specific recombinase
MRDLRTLLNALDPHAGLAQRHIWLISVFEWIRGDESSVPACISRLQTFITTVQAQPEAEARLKAWWHRLLEEVDVTTLLGDFGFAPRTAFMSELAERLRRKMLPGTPETNDASELFPLVAPTRFDAQWLGALEEAQVGQLVTLLQASPKPTPCNGSTA